MIQRHDESAAHCCAALVAIKNGAERPAAYFALAVFGDSVGANGLEADRMSVL
jgi:hypothetical protein